MAVELIVAEGSAWVFSGEAPRRILSREWLKNGSEWQTSDDFRGGIIAAGQGSFTLAPGRTYALRNGQLLSRWQNQWQWILDTGGEPQEQNGPLPDTTMKAETAWPVRLSRPGAFDFRVVQGSILLAEGDRLETGPKGLTKVFLEGLELLLLPRSVLIAGRIPRLIAGGMHISISESASRRELHIAGAGVRMLGQRAYAELLREDVVQVYSLEGILAVLNPAREIQYLLKPGELSRLQKGSPEEPARFALENRVHAWEQALLGPLSQLPPSISVTGDPELGRMMEIQTRAEEWREREEKGLKDPSEGNQPRTTTYDHWLDIPLAQPDILPSGMDRQAATVFPGMGGATNLPPGISGDKIEGRENLLEADSRRVMDERARLREEVARRGVSPEDIRANLLAKGSQLDQTQRFIAQRESDLLRIERDRERIQRDKDNLDRKLRLLQQSGSISAENVAFLMEDKRNLQQQEQALIEAQSRVLALIQEGRASLIQLRRQLDLRLNQDSDFLKRSAERLR